MLISKYVLIFYILSTSVFATDNSLPGIFDKDVLSKMVKPVCEYHRGDETGVFSIKYSEGEISHYFLVMRGIDPETCKWHEREVKKIIKLSKKIILKGRGGNEYSKNGKKEFDWMWISVKSGKNCHSYFGNDCP